MVSNFDELTIAYKKQFPDFKNLSNKGLGLMPFWEEKMLLDNNAIVLKNGELLIHCDYPTVFYLDGHGEKKRNDGGNGNIKACEAVRDGYINNGTAAWIDKLPKTYPAYCEWQKQKTLIARSEYAQEI